MNPTKDPWEEWASEYLGGHIFCQRSATTARDQWPAVPTNKVCKISADWDEEETVVHSGAQLGEVEHKQKGAAAKSQKDPELPPLSAQAQSPKLSEQSVELKRFKKASNKWRQRAQRLKKKALQAFEVGEQLKKVRKRAQRLQAERNTAEREVCEVRNLLIPQRREAAHWRQLCSRKETELHETEDVAHKIKEGYKKVNAELLYFKRKHHLNEDVPVAGFELGILTNQGTSTDGLSLPDLLKHPTHLALQEA